MKKSEKSIIYLIFLAIYLFMGVYNYSKGSQWIIDNSLSVLLLTIMFFMTRFLKIHKPGFLMFNLALLIHNMGSFGFYSWELNWIGYDNIVHFVSSFTAGFITFNFIARKMHVKKGQRVKDTVIDEHLVLTIFLVISTVAMLGTFIELLEFFGYSFLGSGDGIFFVGEGDGGQENYIDTMTDIIVNTVGSISGVIAYYFFTYKKKPWIKNG